MKENNNFYQTPQMSEIEICTEGVLCASQNNGETTDLGKYTMGDIWY